MERIKEILEDKKANDLVVLDVRERSTMTDWLVVASGMSKPHIKALYEDVLVRLKHEGTPCYRHAGEVDGGWLVLDYLNVVVHLFIPEIRAFYQIEDLWKQVPSEAASKVSIAPETKQDDQDTLKLDSKVAKAKAVKRSKPRPSAKQQFESVAKRVRKAPTAKKKSAASGKKK